MVETKSTIRLIKTFSPEFWKWFHKLQDLIVKSNSRALYYTSTWETDERVTLVHRSLVNNIPFKAPPAALLWPVNQPDICYAVSQLGERTHLHSLHSRQYYTQWKESLFVWTRRVTDPVKCLNMTWYALEHKPNKVMMGHNLFLVEMCL